MSGYIEGDAHWPRTLNLALLVISAFINYVDRANLSVGTAAIQSELGLTDYQLGLLLSAFFGTYALLQLVAMPLAR